jgi:hypothetical protein
MTPVVSTTRGVPFDPVAAARQREQGAEKDVRKRAEIDRLRLRAQASSEVSPRKQHAIFLDQVEHAYRERARDRRSA